MEPENSQPNAAAKQPEPNANANPYERRSAKAGQAVIGDFTPQPKPVAPKPAAHPAQPKAPEVKIPKIPKKPKAKKVRNYNVLKIVISIVVMAAIAASFWQRQAILDWYALRDYKPPVAIVELANDSYMNSEGRKIFYLNKPQVQQKAEFYQSCHDGEAVILGCYKPRDGIYLLIVDDQRLDGVEQVTAAHEMLHAAHDRLSFKERQEIDALVKNTYNSIDNKAVKEKVQLYLDGGADTTNELHSILGTEVDHLPAELETYYARYFYNRKGVVALSNKFQSEFTKRKQKVANLDKQLASIEKRVKDNNTKLDDMEGPIIAESTRLEALLAANQIAEYNQGVVAYNQSLTPYNNLLNQTKQLINQYKTTLTERNKVAVEAQELNRSLDSSITTDAKEIR